MHAYATDSKDRNNLTLLLLGVIAALLAYAFFKVFAYYNWHIPWFIETPSPLAIFGLLFLGFDKVAWKWKVFHFLGLVKTPNLNGEWKTKIKSSYDNFQTEHEATISICQNWTSMQVNLKKPGSSVSCSNSGALFGDCPEGTVLTYQYMNEPFGEAINSMNIHYGTARLVVDKGLKSMEGLYYSGRGRMTHGTLKLEKIN